MGKCDVSPVHIVFAIVVGIFSNFISAEVSTSWAISSSTLSTNSAVTFTRQCNWMFKENPKDCGSYFQCLNGRAVLRRCARALYWNAEGSYCDWRSKTNCKAGKRPGIKPSSTLQTKPKESCPANTYKPHPTDCSKYIQCGILGQSDERECTPGLLWDVQINGCNWAFMVNCNVGAGGDTTPPPVVIPTSTLQPFIPVSTEATTTSPPWIPETTTTAAPIITFPTTTTTPTTTTVATTTTRPRPTTIAPRPPTEYKVVCYFTNWAIYRPEGGNFAPSHIDPSLCTHVIYAFGCMNPITYKMEMCDSWIDGKEGRNFYGQITDLQKHGIKTLIAVGGWNDSGYKKWTEMLKDLLKMETFIQSVCEFLNTHNFNGIDLDYEYPSCPQANCNYDSRFEKQAFVTLIKGLRLKCGPSVILSAAVSCNENIMREAYDVPTMSKHLDIINLMSYDFHGAWEPKTGINAPAYKTAHDEHYSTENLNTYHAVRAYIGMKADPKKICLGMPTYAQTFLLANVRENGIGAKSIGPGHAGPFTRQKGMLSYYETCLSDWTETVHDAQRKVGPYSYNAETGQWASRDSQSIFKEKCNIIKDLGLGGGMIWALDLDDYDNKCGEGRFPLLTALANELLGRPTDRTKKVTQNAESSKTNKNKKTKLRRRKGRK